MIRYVVTSHAHLPGVFLSRDGSWGNIPIATQEAAETAAESDAKGHPFHIRHERHRLRSQVSRSTPQFI